MTETYDLAVVGAGILGLAHALAAARRGLKVVVFDRDAQANGASVRNFGFVTVTGQQAGECWSRAKRSRDIWAEVAASAGIAIEQRGLMVLARRQEAAAVLEAFAGTEMGEACELLTADGVHTRAPEFAGADIAAGLWSPHELRVDSRDAIPRLATWLETAHKVDIRRQVLVRTVDPPAIETTAGIVRAGACVVCPGDDFLGLFSDRIAAYGLTRCKLHMMRVAPPRDGWRLTAPVMSDLVLVRYLGYADLPEAEVLRLRLVDEQREALANGVHLIAVQNADGSLVVGDSHHYGPTPEPFAADAVDRLILDEYRAATGLPEPVVLERWTGTYASAGDRLALIDAPADRVRLAIVTSGTGASTGFAIGEEVIDDLFGES